MGDMKQFHDHLSFFNRANADTVIISPGHHVCKMDYNKILAFHRNSGADITVVYKDFSDSLVEKPIYHKCLLNEEGKIVDISLFNVPKAGDHISLETYVISKSVLVDLIKKCVANEEYDFLKDAVKANLHHLNVKGFHFTGELPFIHSLESFHASNMKFLNPNVLKSFFNEDWSIFTKIKHEAPAKYAQTSNVSNSLVANGCHIEGTVENSILFRGVKVKKGAVVKNSIIMQKGEIGEGAFVENVITDKEVKITNKQVVVGKQKPTVIKKAEII
jgi:glucose-1-phosphate adenylyltransferase